MFFDPTHHSPISTHVVIHYAAPQNSSAFDSSSSSSGQGEVNDLISYHLIVPSLTYMLFFSVWFWRVIPSFLSYPVPNPFCFFHFVLNIFSFDRSTTMLQICNSTVYLP